MRRARVVIVVVLLSGLIGLVALAMLERTSLGFTLGVVSSAPVAPLSGGQEVCQLPIDVPNGGDFNRLAFRVGTYGKQAGPPLVASVRDLAGRTVARGELAAGYPDIGASRVEGVRLDNTVDAHRIEVCLANLGPGRVAIYGGADAAARSSSAFLDGRPISADIEIAFDRGARSLAELAPNIFERASRFGFAWEGAWLYWLLGSALLFGGPWLLWRALALAARNSGTD